MSDALDRSGGADGPAAVEATAVAASGIASIGAGQTGGSDRDVKDIGKDISDSGRKAHGSRVSNDNVLHAVETTIEVAESVLLAAARAVDAGKRHSRRAAVPVTAERANGFRVEPEGIPPSLRTDILPSSGLRRDPPTRWRSFALWGLGGAVSVLIAVMIAGNPLSGGRPAGSSGPGLHVPAGTPPVAAAESAAEPRLVVGSGARGGAGQALALGVAIDHPTDAAGLLVDGLPDGAALSAGQPSGANQWYVPAADVAGAVVRPPRGFAGAVDLSVELWLAGGRVAERRAVRLEWGRPAPPPSVGVAGLPPRQLDPEEIASLRRRGEALFANGDIAAARLMLMRAAEAADARAALLLATTYDPMALADNGIRGAFANPLLARAWYERAKAFGSPDAPRRLELLASQEH